MEDKGQTLEKKSVVENVNPFDAFQERYHKNPVLFVQEVIGARPDPRQAAILTDIAAGYRRISVRSGHGVGKSTTASWAMIWYLYTRFPVKIVTTAPTSSQLFDALFAELNRWISALNPELRSLVKITQDRVELKAAPDEAFISARTSRAETPEALQGIHSDHVMLIADEASGVPEQVFEAAAGSMSGHSAVTLLLGNPVRSSGFFYDTHHRLSGDWRCHKLSCLDSPRVSADYVRQIATTYGEESNAYRIRVLGEFPKADDDTLIAMELIESAKVRDVAVVASAPRIWGLDVARFGADSSALVERQGNTATVIREWRNLDTMQLTGAVVHEWESRQPDTRPVEIVVDSIGIGAGVVDRLRELQLPAIGVNVGESPSMGGQYLNLRAELWSKCEKWLRSLDCKIPPHEKLISGLASCKYKFSSNGKLQIESKEDMKRRGLPSPDVADALVLTFASAAATATHGGNRSWTKPLKWALKGIV